MTTMTQPQTDSPTDTEPRTVGYCRVSTADGRQKTDLQRDALQKAGVEMLFEDTCSGALASRPGLDRCLAELRRGDTLVVWRLDRLGRSLPHLLEVVTDLDSHGVHLRSLGDHIDTSSATGRLIFHVMASLAQFERELTAERITAGVKAYRERHGRWGRREAVTAEKLDTAKLLTAGGLSITETAKRIGVGRSTLYRALAAEHDDSA